MALGGAQIRVPFRPPADSVVLPGHTALRFAAADAKSLIGRNEIRIRTFYLKYQPPWRCRHDSSRFLLSARSSLARS